MLKYNHTCNWDIYSNCTAEHLQGNRKKLIMNLCQVLSKLLLLSINLIVISLSLNFAPFASTNCCHNGLPRAYLNLKSSVKATLQLIKHRHLFQDVLMTCCCFVIWRMRMQKDRHCKCRPFFQNIHSATPYNFPKIQR